MLCITVKFKGSSTEVKNIRLHLLNGKSISLPTWSHRILKNLPMHTEYIPHYVTGDGAATIYTLTQ